MQQHASAFAAVSYWLGRDPAPSSHVPKERVGDVVRRFKNKRRTTTTTEADESGAVAPTNAEPDRTPVPAGAGVPPAPPEYPGATSPLGSVSPASPNGTGGPANSTSSGGSAEPTREYTFPPFDPPTEPPTR